MSQHVKKKKKKTLSRHDYHGYLSIHHQINDINSQGESMNMIFSEKNPDFCCFLQHFPPRETAAELTGFLKLLVRCKRRKIRLKSACETWFGFHAFNSPSRINVAVVEKERRKHPHAGYLVNRQP